MEDEKLAALGLSDQLPPSAQGLLQGAQSHSSFSSQVIAYSPAAAHNAIMETSLLLITWFCVYFQLPAPVLNTHVVINQKLSTLGLQLHFQRWLLLTHSIL